MISAVPLTRRGFLWRAGLVAAAGGLMACAPVSTPVLVEPTDAPRSEARPAQPKPTAAVAPAATGTREPGPAPSVGRSIAVGALAQPRGVAMGPDGTVYIADAARRAIIAVPAGGGPARALAEGEFLEPVAVAVRPDGSLVVIDYGAGGIWLLSRDGTVGEQVAPHAGLYGPRGIAAAADGRLVVADTGNNRLLLLAPDGAVQRISDVLQPSDATFLPDGTLLAAETSAKQFAILRSDGQRVASWPMSDSDTAIGPHVAALPGGGWVATAPNEHSVLRMAPGGGSPETWLTDPRWDKPSGIAAGS